MVRGWGKIGGALSSGHSWTVIGQLIRVPPTNSAWLPVIVKPGSLRGNVKEKLCTKCNTMKRLDEFNRETRKKDGRQCWCRRCMSELRASRSVEISEKYRQNLQRTRYSPAGRIKAHLFNAKRNAERRNVPFDLTKKTLPPYPGNCPCCDVIMEYGAAQAITPTLDRIIPALGYVPGNIQWLCHRCNWRKSDASLEDLMQIASRVASITPGGMLTMRGLANRTWEDRCLQEPVEIHGRWYAPVDWGKAFAKSLDNPSELV